MLPLKVTRRLAIGLLLSVSLALAAAWWIVHLRSPEARLGRYWARGNAALEAGRYGEAALDFRAVLQIGSRSAPAYYKLGLAYLRSGEMGAASLMIRS
jgi:tetratricopeptide (TPR) repeat protein